MYTQKVSEEHAQNDGCKQRCDYFLDGSDYLEAVVDGIIKHGDVVFMMSVDGAQLNESTMSDFWVGIWVVFDRSPEMSYKMGYVLPCFVVRGPRKPTHLK